MNSSESLRGYGKEIHERDKWKCRYCGFDGSEFDMWLLLSVSHVIPQHQQNEVNIDLDDPRNLVTSCRMCNGFRNRTKFEIPKNGTFEYKVSSVLEQKTRAIKAERAKWRDYWLQNIKPNRIP